MGMAWKEALKRLKDHHAAGLAGVPATMQKELEGLEESLKGWEDRDESREKSFQSWKEADAQIRRERDASKESFRVASARVRQLPASPEQAELAAWMDTTFGGLNEK